jgi:hypothetical protein
MVRIRIRIKRPDLDPYQIEKQDQDPYQSEKKKIRIRIKRVWICNAAYVWYLYYISR